MQLPKVFFFLFFPVRVASEIGRLACLCGNVFAWIFLVELHCDPKHEHFSECRSGYVGSKCFSCIPDVGCVSVHSCGICPWVMHRNQSEGLPAVYVTRRSSVTCRTCAYRARRRPRARVARSPRRGALGPRLAGGVR